MTYPKGHKRQSVLDKIRKENETFIIKIIGNKQDKVDAFTIITNTQSVYSDRIGYHGIKRSTMDLLEKAEIKVKIIDPFGKDSEKEKGK